MAVRSTSYQRDVLGKRGITADTAVRTGGARRYQASASRRWAAGLTTTSKKHAAMGDLAEALRAALREAGYGPDAIGSALPRIMRILQAEDVRLEAGRPLSRKEREYVRVQLEMGVDVSEIVAGLKRAPARGPSKPA